MSERTTRPSTAVRLVDILSAGWEPAPARFIARRSYYPWLVVGTTSIATFIGQLDASIVQLGLPTLEHQFQVTRPARSRAGAAERTRPARI
jgi:hypothetical protein